MKKPSLIKRFRAKKMTQPVVAGVTWYTEEDWRKVKAAATDPERFEETFAEWNAMAVEAVANLKKAGVNTVKFFIIPNELLPWCQLHNKPNNAASRAEFVTQKLQEQSEKDA
jgi:hypothetical protein